MMVVSAGAQAGDQPPATTVGQVHGALLGVMRVLHDHTATCAAGLGLTPAQAVTLFQLQQRGALPMRELASEQHCDPSNITGIADRLEARGLVERRPEPGDRRVKLLALTPEGRAATAELSTRAIAGVPGLSGLTHEELVQLLGLLQRILADAGADPVHSGRPGPQLPPSGERQRHGA
jgi:DNA-binding MarR family transcriptional regulator